MLAMCALWPEITTTQEPLGDTARPFGVRNLPIPTTSDDSWTERPAVSGVGDSETR